MRRIEIIINSLEFHLLVLEEKCNSDFVEYDKYITIMRGSCMPSKGIMNTVSILNEYIK